MQANVNNRRIASIAVDDAHSCAQHCLDDDQCLSFVLYSGDAPTPICDTYSKIWKWNQLIDMSTDTDAGNGVDGTANAGVTSANGALYCKHLLRTRTPLPMYHTQT